MLHRKGNRVDVEALHDRIPLRQGAGKGPQMGSHRYIRLRRWKSVFVDASGGLGDIWEYIGERIRPGGSRRAHKGGGRALPCWAHPSSLWPPRGSSDSISKSLGCLLVQEKSSRRFYSIWTSFGSTFPRNSKTGKKQQFALGLRLIGQSQKSYKIAYKCI